MNEVVLCGDNSLYEELRKHIGRRVKGARGYGVLKEMKHRITPAASGGVTFHGCAEHGTHLELISANGRPTSFTSAPTTLVDSSRSPTAPVSERLLDGDVSIMKRVCLLDTRADDSKSGLIYGAVTPRVTARMNHTIGSATHSIPTPTGGAIAIDDMQRFGIAGYHGYTGAGHKKVTVVSPYLGINSSGYASTNGLSTSVYEPSGSFLVSAGNRLGVIVDYNDYDSGHEKFLSCGLGGTVTITLGYVRVTSDPTFSLVGIGQDGKRVTLATFKGETTDAGEENTATLSASAASFDTRLSAAYVTADVDVTVTTANGVLTSGNSDRSDLQCVISIEGTAANDTVTFEGSTLFVGAPAEPSLSAHELDEGVDLDAIVRNFGAVDRAYGDGATLHTAAALAKPRR
jgi:hypothetical protein